jgi:L-ribulose-5-phosphate 4-epimerase
MAIKPSGARYESLEAEDIVVISLADGSVVAGRQRPSSDAPAHLELYRRFPAIGSVVHTHSRFATVWAQAGRDLPCLGTTHADHFRGAVPVTAVLSRRAVADRYEENTAVEIVDLFRRRSLDPAEMPGALVRGHGPFTWGVTIEEALENAVVLEYAAAMAFDTERLRGRGAPLRTQLRDRHFFRKHGPAAYYGQPSTPPRGRA